MHKPAWIFLICFCRTIIPFRSRILTGSGPEPEGEILIKLLDDFQTYLTEHGFASSGSRGADLHVLFTGREYTNNAGYAYTGTVCVNPPYAAAVLKFFWAKKKDEDGGGAEDEQHKVSLYKSVRCRHKYALQA